MNNYLCDRRFNAVNYHDRICIIDYENDRTDEIGIRIPLATLPQEKPRTNGEAQIIALLYLLNARYDVLSDVCRIC